MVDSLFVQGKKICYHRNNSPNVIEEKYCTGPYNTFLHLNIDNNSYIYIERGAYWND